MWVRTIFYQGRPRRGDDIASFRLTFLAETKFDRRRGAIMRHAREVLEGERQHCWRQTHWAKTSSTATRLPSTIAGTFSSNLAREFFAESHHLVVSTGPARNFTTAGGHLYPNAKVAQIDTKPRELPDAPRTAISISEPMLAPRPKRSQGS